MPFKLKTNKHPSDNTLHVSSIEKHAEPNKDDESNWLVSYADMMTLLCGFFIILFSMAKMDAPEYDSFKEAVSKQFGGEYVSPTKEMKRMETEVLKELGVETSAVVKSDAYGVSISFESTLFFETLSSEISPKGKELLDKIIESIALRQKENNKQYKIVVEGHTDGRPVVGGIYPSNWELSGARAARVVRIFLEREFIPEKLVGIGYADTRPLALARKLDGSWDDRLLAKNRRVIIRILEPNTESIPFPEAPDTTVASAAKSAH